MVGHRQVAFFMGVIHLARTSAEPAECLLRENLIYHIDFMNYFMNIIPAAWLLKEIFPQFATGKGFR